MPACPHSELQNDCHCSAQYCTASADGTTRVWDLATHAQLYEFDTPGEAALCCAYHPTRRELACGYDSGRVRAFDVAKAALVQEQQQHRAAVTDILFSPSGLLLFSMGESLVLQLAQLPSAHLGTWCWLLPLQGSHIKKRAGRILSLPVPACRQGRQPVCLRCHPQLWSSQVPGLDHPGQAQLHGDRPRFSGAGHCRAHWAAG